MVGVLVSGFVSWLVPLTSARWVTVVHAILGFFVVIITPFKVRGSVRTGLKRKRSTRYGSIAFGLVVIAALVAGITHTTGAFFSTGVGTPLWIHILLGVVAIPLLFWHVFTRPVRPKPTDLNRRGVITTSVGGALAVAALGTQEVLLNATGARGADRGGTGSIEIASFQPAEMPRVSWFNDQGPTAVTPSRWALRIDGESVNVVDDLAPIVRPVQALSLIHI